MGVLTSDVFQAHESQQRRHQPEQQRRGLAGRPGRRPSQRLRLRKDRDEVRQHGDVPLGASQEPGGVHPGE
jgi:hypothetical protein